ncbi:DNA repair protein RecO [Candidatus Kuenenbacteria bacterium]|nr:DNA repair protein RecO [Candidatus Kuenenbacteria bacterium]
MYYNLTAIVLKRQDFRDDDLLVTVYSRERGKLTIVARGGKKILSKLAGHLEPVSLVLLNIASGKSIDQLTGASLQKGYQKIKADLARTVVAISFLKLLDQLTLDNHKDERIFELAVKYLDFLDKKEEDYEIAKLSAGFKLLALLGLNPAEKVGSPKEEIKFIIKNNIRDIYENKNIKTKIKDLEKILNSEVGNVT